MHLRRWLYPKLKQSLLPLLPKHRLLLRQYQQLPRLKKAFSAGSKACSVVRMRLQRQRLQQPAK